MADYYHIFWITFACILNVILVVKSNTNTTMAPIVTAVTNVTDIPSNGTQLNSTHPTFLGTPANEETTTVASATMMNTTVTPDRPTTISESPLNATMQTNVSTTTMPFFVNTTESSINSTISSNTTDMFSTVSSVNFTTPSSLNDTATSNETNVDNKTEVPDVSGNPNTTNDTSVSTTIPPSTQITNVTTTESVNTTDIFTTPNTTEMYTTPNITEMYTTPNTTNMYTTPNTTDMYTTPNTTDMYTTPNTTNDTSVSTTIPPSTQITNVTTTESVNTTDIFTTPNTTEIYTTPNSTEMYATSNTTEMYTTLASIQTDDNVTTIRTTTNFTTITPNTTMSTGPIANDTTNTTQTPTIQPTTEPIVTSATGLPVTFVFVILDSDHKPVAGPVVQLTSTSRSFDTRVIPFETSSHILRTDIFVDDDDRVVVMVMKPGYATNALRWVHGDDTYLIILLAKLEPAVVNIENNTVHVETTQNVDGNTARIEFIKLTSGNLSADCLLTTDLNLLPDPGSNSQSGIVTLVTYAAIQITLHNGDTEITLVDGGFDMTLPITDEKHTIKDGDRIPAWYFDEESGEWTKSGDGKVQKTPSGVTMWHFSAPHLSWWMAADQPTVVGQPGDDDDGLLGSITGTQFLMLLIIACLGIFGIGAMIIFICIKPKEKKGVRQNGSSRSRKEDSISDMAASNTNLANNIELKENNIDIQDDDLPPPPPPLEPPTLSIGMANPIMDSDNPDDVVLNVPDSENNLDETSSYIYSSNLDVSDCNDKIDDSSSFVYTNQTFLNVGGQKDREDTGSILDHCFNSDDDSQSASHNSGPSEDESSISYKENIVV